MRILAVGDVVGSTGVAHLEATLRAFVAKNKIDFTVVNGENASDVHGLSSKDAAKIFDVMVQSSGADGDAYLVARILKACGADARGEILGAMEEENAAIVTNIMEPESSIDTSGSSPSAIPIQDSSSSDTDTDEDEED